MTSERLYGGNLGEHSYLLEMFREFYSEFLTIKQRVGSNTDSFTDADSAEFRRRDANELTKDVWQKLMDVFEDQEVQAKRNGGEYGYRLYKDAQYIMAVLADDVLLNTEWRGKELWMVNLLETSLFQTHAAGDVFFQRVENLLSQRDTLRPEIAALYLYALSLGFQGRYRNSDSVHEVESYKKRLYEFIYRKRPSLIGEEKVLNDSAYKYTITDGTIVRLPVPRKWIVIAAGIVVVFLCIAHILWYAVTSDIRPLIETINQFN